MSVIKIKNYRRWEKYYNSWLYVLFHLRTCIKNYRLTKKYPFLYPRDCWGDGGAPKHYHYQYTDFDMIPEGWRKAFGIMMMDDILKACKLDHINPKGLYVIECKEKYGGLRFELSNFGDNIHHVLSCYEQVSQNICYFCGKVDVPLTNFGWILPECEECYCEQYNTDSFRYEMTIKNYKKEDLRIPDSFKIIRNHEGVSIKEDVDLTWITNRLRKEEE